MNIFDLKTLNTLSSQYVVRAPSSELTKLLVDNISSSQLETIFKKEVNGHIRGYSDYDNIFERLEYKDNYIINECSNLVIDIINNYSLTELEDFFSKYSENELNKFKNKLTYDDINIGMTVIYKNKPYIVEDKADVFDDNSLNYEHIYLKGHKGSVEPNQLSLSS